MSDVNLSISQEVVKPIIEAKIQAAITKELEGAATMMDRIVYRVLMAKVDSDGKESCYARGDLTYVQWLCQECIRKAALSALEEASKSMQPKLKALIVKELERQKGQIAGDLVGFFVKATDSYYKVHANVSIQKRE